MDKAELNIWKKQIFALILIYIACMLPIVYTNPKSAAMDCTSNYICKVEMRYVFSISQSAEFRINNRTKLRFYDSDTYHSGFINLYENEYGSGINLDPFGTGDFYTCSSQNEIIEQQQKMANIIIRFKNYVENPQKEFHIEKEYDTSNFNLIGGIITLLCAGLAFTKRPLTFLFTFFTKKY